jgi:hypothetical protein
MKSYREAGPSTAQPSAGSNIQQGAMKIDGAPAQDINQPQTVQVQYVDQDGNVLHGWLVSKIFNHHFLVVNQQAFVTTSDNNAVYLNNQPTINEANYENA